MHTGSELGRSVCRQVSWGTQQIIFRIQKLSPANFFFAIIWSRKQTFLNIISASALKRCSKLDRLKTWISWTPAMCCSADIRYLMFYCWQLDGRRCRRQLLTVRRAVSFFCLVVDDKCYRWQWWRDSVDDRHVHRIPFRLCHLLYDWLHVARDRRRRKRCRHWRSVYRCHFVNIKSLSYI